MKTDKPTTLDHANWKGYIVTQWEFKEAFEILIPRLRLECTVESNEASFSFNNNAIPPPELSEDKRDLGWRAMLCERMTRINHGSEEGNKRWLYRVLSGESLVASADLADACFLAADTFMDIPVWPGKVGLARQMVRDRLEWDDIIVSGEEFDLRVEQLMFARNEAILRHGLPERFSSVSEKARARNRTPTRMAIRAQKRKEARAA